MKIYFAAPLFTKGERDFNDTVASLLRQLGHEVFLPQEQEQRNAAKQIFDSDYSGIVWADLIVANMDGADPDSGTCWECGCAVGERKPVILYRTDIREERPPFGPYNLMLTQSARVVLDCKWDSCSMIALKIDRALKELYETLPIVKNSAFVYDEHGPAAPD